MEIASIGRLIHRPKPKSANRPEGFSLLEMMMVVTVILIVASISAPIYMTAVVRAREAVLADHLFTLRALIDRFTLDNGRAPASLQEIVEKGYQGRVLTDPFTGSNETWQVHNEDAPLSPDANPSVGGKGVRYPFQGRSFRVVFGHGKSQAGGCGRDGLPRPEPGEFWFASFQEGSALSGFSGPDGRELGKGRGVAMVERLRLAVRKRKPKGVAQSV